MYEIKMTNRFKRDYKLAIKRGYNSNLLSEVITLISSGKVLPEKYKDHNLTGNWKEIKMM